MRSAMPRCAGWAQRWSTLSFRRRGGALGGDEFVIGMYGMRREDAAQRLQTLLDALKRERFQVPDGPRIEITFSAGIAQYPEDGLTAHALYLVADRALYAAKAAGKSQVHSAARKSKAPQEHGDWDVVLVEDDARARRKSATCSSSPADTRRTG